GKNVGIQLASTVGFDLLGGYWDIDNVRLNVTPDLRLKDLVRTAGQWQFTIEGERGRFDILASTDVGLPVQNWTNLGTVTNSTGRVTCTDTKAAHGMRFYRAR